VLLPLVVISNTVRLGRRNKWIEAISHCEFISEPVSWAIYGVLTAYLPHIAYRLVVVHQNIVKIAYIENGTKSVDFLWKFA